VTASRIIGQSYFASRDINGGMVMRIMVGKTIFLGSILMALVCTMTVAQAITVKDGNNTIRFRIDGDIIKDGNNRKIGLIDGIIIKDGNNRKIGRIDGSPRRIQIIAILYFFIL
jgi:hypothetical protein